MMVFDARTGFESPFESTLLLAARPPEDAGTLNRLLDALPPLESATAKRFVHAADRAAYLSAHALLRCSLSRLALAAGSNCPPAFWQFESGEHGKPQLLQTGPLPGAQVSLSHSRSMVAIAIGFSGPLGVDVEPIDHPHAHARESAPVVFTDSECSWIDATENALSERFARLWTAKEAWAKALGAGLSHDLRTLSVDLRSGRYHSGKPGHWQADLRWQLHAWHMGGHIVSLACSPAREIEPETLRALPVRLPGLDLDTTLLAQRITPSS